MVSVGVVIAGILIIFTGWYWLDGASGILIALVILISNFSLLKDSLNLSIDAVPKGIKLPEVQQQLTSVKGVISLHNLHIWAISTTYNSLTAHVVVADKISMFELTVIKKEIRHRLEHLNIAHSKLEFEMDKEDCNEEI